METKIKQWVQNTKSGKSYLRSYIAIVENDKNGEEREIIGFGTKKAKAIVEQYAQIVAKLAELEKMKTEIIAPAQPLPMPQSNATPADIASFI